MIDKEQANEDEKRNEEYNLNRASSRRYDESFITFENNFSLSFSFVAKVAKLAQEQILPLVRKMDDDHKFDDGVVKLLFDNGLMGVEADPEFGGSGCNFLTMMLVCEELSKVSDISWPETTSQIIQCSFSDWEKKLARW